MLENRKDIRGIEKRGFENSLFVIFMYFFLVLIQKKKYPKEKLGCRPARLPGFISV